MSFDVPVALVFFNRPKTLEKVFEKVREVQPQKLFLIQDGPRNDHPEDVTNIAQCREIVGKIDWDCEVISNYSPSNLGCGMRIATGISWVFENVDRVIILEDDCVPDLTFFPFCKEMLKRYEFDERIMLVSGTNHLREYSPDGASYLFSKGLAIWGWATWKRAWCHFDYNLSLWKNCEVRELVYQDIAVPHMRKNRDASWSRIVNRLDEGVKLSEWAAQWQFAVYAQSGLGIVPKHNLITNLGFGQDATNNKRIVPQFILPTKPLDTTYKHPTHVVCDRKYDEQLFKMIFPEVPFYIKVGSKVKRTFLSMRTFFYGRQH